MMMAMKNWRGKDREKERGEREGGERVRGREEE